jgi:hypothetical protein
MLSRDPPDAQLLHARCELPAEPAALSHGCGTSAMEVRLVLDRKAFSHLHVDGRIFMGSVVGRTWRYWDVIVYGVFSVECIFSFHLLLLG